MEKKERILKVIDSWKNDQIEFLTAICNQNSYTANKKGVDLVSSIICEKLDEIFPIHELSKQRETGDHHILRSAESGRSLYLLGHVDTVFPQEHPFRTCRTENGWLHGPGTADMKGGLAVMIYALRALYQVDELPEYDLTMILGGDEEAGSASSRDIYLRERQNAFACLAAECGSEKGEFVISRNGKLGGRLDCCGKDRHVGTVSHKKASAILEMAHKIIDLESLNSLLPGTRHNAGCVQGGLGPATIPSQASLLFDVRWENEDQFEEIEYHLQKIVNKNHQRDCISRMTFLNRRPAMPPNKMNAGMISLLEKTGFDLNIPIGFEHRYGSSDANFFGAAGIPTLDGFGPVGLRDHTPEERICLDSLIERTKLLALFLSILSPEAV
jgi:glutamate carboxypeptidase